MKTDIFLFRPLPFPIASRKRAMMSINSVLLIFFSSNSKYLRCFQSMASAFLTYGFMSPIRCLSSSWNSFFSRSYTRVFDVNSALDCLAVLRFWNCFAIIPGSTQLVQCCQVSGKNMFEVYSPFTKVHDLWLYYAIKPKSCFDNEWKDIKSVWV